MVPRDGLRLRAPDQGFMSGRRRFLSALFGGRVDRPAVANGSSVVTLELMEMAEARFPDVHLDGVKAARLAATAHEVLGYDAVMPVFSGHAESAAMGCDVVWGERDSWPDTRDHPFDEAEKVRMPSDFLECPSMRAVLDAISLLRRDYGDRVAVIGKVYGPWNLAYHLLGTEELLVEMMVDPDKVRRYLDATMEISLVSAKAQIEAGADAILWCDNATGDLVRAESYRDFLLSLHREITKAVGCPLILHICGETADRLQYVVQAGFDCLHFDSKVNARLAKEIVGDRMSLMGNVNCPTTLRTGSPEDVRREALVAMEAGVEIPAPECVVPLTTPIASLKAIVEAACDFGRQSRKP